VRYGFFSLSCLSDKSPHLAANMRYALSLTALLVQSCTATWLLPTARNFIYIVPDGYGQASQTMARDYVSLLQNGENADAPVSIKLAADGMVIGTVQTLASDNLITDSAASATAFGCGVKTYNNGMLAVRKTSGGQANRCSNCGR
jgi:alkaline phosphatase